MSSSSCKLALLQVEEKPPARVEKRFRSAALNIFAWRVVQEKVDIQYAATPTRIWV